MAEAYSDEEIKGPCAAPHRGCSFGKWEKWPYECLDCRYLATITARDKRIEHYKEMEKRFDVVRECYELSQKRIEELEKRVKIMGDCIDEMDNQTATIERLREELWKIGRGSIIPSWEKGNGVESKIELKCLGCICKRDTARQALDAGKE